MIKMKTQKSGWLLRIFIFGLGIFLSMPHLDGDESVQRRAEIEIVADCKQKLNASPEWENVLCNDLNRFEPAQAAQMIISMNEVLSSNLTPELVSIFLKSQMARTETGRHTFTRCILASDVSRADIAEQTRAISLCLDLRVYGLVFTNIEDCMKQNKDITWQTAYEVCFVNPSTRNGYNGGYSLGPSWL